MSTPFLWEDSNAMTLCRRNMDVNFYGAAEMSHAILAEWLRPEAPYKEPKHLIFTASVLALFAVAGYGPYTPSKWALRGLADTLAQEVMLYPNNPVKIHVVYPGTILSPGFERETQTKPAVTIELEKDDPKQTPEEVATAAIAGLERGDHFITINYLGSMMRWSVLGGSLRNNWIVDLVMGWIMNPLWYIIVNLVVLSGITGYAKKHGHPSTWPKKQ